jgi:tetratricopeptide (TPR) repeat protein
LTRPRLFLVIAVLSLGLAGGRVSAEEGAGPYLAGRVASLQSDYAAAADYFTRALLVDPTDVSIMENALLAQIGTGNFDKALTLSKGLNDAGQKSSLADLVVLASLAKQGQFEAALAELDKGRSSGVLIDGLYRAWAKLGSGQMSEAATAFDAVAKTTGLSGFAYYHKALALASVGDFEGADAIFSGKANGPIRATRRSIIAHAEVLSQLERNKDAVEMIDKIFGPDLDAKLSAMRADLVAGKTLPFTMINSPVDGMAEAFYTVAAALSGDSSPDNASSPTDILMFARAAIYLRPDFDEAILLAASILEDQGQHDLAIASYHLVAPTSAAYATAELGRAQALVAENHRDAAIEALQQLTKANPDDVNGWIGLGDLFRGTERFSDAVSAYDKAIALFETPQADHWVAYYARGICYERLKDWPKAEADFRKSLELSPDQPQVLNYLGYSMVEMNTNLDEATAMIERAAKARPDEGAIIDSLGWALFRQGRYAEAEVQMEQAIELMPVDSVVNDHLGDVYWAVGRVREAEFQWKRALSFKPENEEAASRIRRKLEIGLDAVLQEEGAKPLDVSANGG